MSARRTAAPVLLPPNPVWRSYAGGRGLRRFRALPGGEDDHFPEDWLASTVRARNGKNSRHPQEGLSRVADGRLVIDLLKQEPDFWLGTDPAKRGPENSPGVLWKLLDASVRLQFQAHPDANFARRHLHSNAGKTECWYILGTRGDAHVYLGFQHPPTREAWAQMIRQQRVDEMTACFGKIPVRSGDCYVVPAGTPHAIGAGVFMMELMEPTDWVVRCETVNAGVTLPPEACFMGLDLETCLDIFDYRAHSLAEVRKTFQQPPRQISQSGSFLEEELIGPAWREFFRLHRLRGNGDASWSGNELMLLIVLKGGGILGAGTETREVRAGQTWLLPGSAPHWEWREPAGDWEILLAKLPAVPTTK
jgi:mannose-6-phosphate isomerase